MRTLFMIDSHLRRDGIEQTDSRRHVVVVNILVGRKREQSIGETARRGHAARLEKTGRHRR